MHDHKTGTASLANRALATVALFFWALAVWLGMLGTVGAQAPAPASAAAIPDPAQLALCQACHGPQGNSVIAQMPSLAGQPKIFLENQMVLIREGIRDLPQMKGMLTALGDADLVRLAQYFSAQTAAPLAAGASAYNAASWQRGKEISQKMYCGTCHRPDYSGQQQVPRLAAQHEAYLIDSMKQ